MTIDNVDIAVQVYNQFFFASHVLFTCNIILLSLMDYGLRAITFVTIDCLATLIIVLHSV